MSSLNDVASGFSITGLLDSNSATRSRYPIVELALEDISDHPSNSIYSMDEASIEKLAASIKEDGLTDIPLVRKLSNGSFQMLSGHRRKAAFARLAETDDAYGAMPCRVIEGIDDERAETLLHTANYFTRSLSVTERAAATRALGLEVERLRAEDDSYSGMRSEDIKASIISEQTGRNVSGRTVRREEDLAELIETKISDSWKEDADAGRLSNASVKRLASMTKLKQERVRSKVEDDMSSRQIAKAIAEASAPKETRNERLAKAAESIIDILLSKRFKPSEADLSLLSELRETLDSVLESCKDSSSSAEGRV